MGIRWPLQGESFPLPTQPAPFTLSTEGYHKLILTPPLSLLEQEKSPILHATWIKQAKAIYVSTIRVIISHMTELTYRGNFSWGKFFTDHVKIDFYGAKFSRMLSSRQPRFRIKSWFSQVNFSQVKANSRKPRIFIPRKFAIWQSLWAQMLSYCSYPLFSYTGFSPLLFDGLSSGQHRLAIRPLGCAKRLVQVYFFFVPWLLIRTEDHTGQCYRNSH